MDTTQEYKNAVQSPSRKWKANINIYASDLISIFGKDVVNAKITESTFAGTVGIGNVTSSIFEAEVVLLKKKKLTEMELDFKLSLQIGETYEDVNFPTFYITSAIPVNGTNHIKITAYDAIMKKTSKRAYASGLTYPATIEDVAKELSGMCDLVWDESIIWQNFTLMNAIEVEKCREAFSYIGELMGGNVFINRSGKLDIRFLSETDVVINPNRYYAPFEHSDTFYYIYSVTMNTETGSYTKVVADRDESYIPIKLNIDNNFATQRITNYVGGKLNFSFQKCDSLSFLGDPSLCPGDIITVIGLNGEECKIAIMQHIIEFDGGVKSTVASYADVEEISEYSNSSRRNSGNISKDKILSKAYEDAAKLLEEWADSGYVRVLPNEILIMNMPDKETATKVWRFNEGGLAFYPNGLDSEVINLALTMDGQIVADRIKFGTLGDQKGKFWVNMETGEMQIGSNALIDGSMTLSQYVSNVTANISVILSNEYEAIQTDSDGNYADFLDINTTVQVMYGTTDISDKCTYSMSPVNLAGEWNNSTRTYTVTNIEADKGWVDITVTYLGGLNFTKRFTVAKIYGAEVGYFYELESVQQTITLNDDGTSPISSVNFSAYSREVNSTARKAYAGKFVIENQNNEGSWVVVYSSFVAETEVEFDFNYSITSNIFLVNEDGDSIIDNTGFGLLTQPSETTAGVIDYTHLRCTLYAAEDTDSTMILARKTIDFVKQAEKLTHEGVFNLLTEDGRHKAIFMQDGELYISFTYARGGTLKLGGANNGNGEMVVYDSNGKETVRCNKNGVKAIAGTIGQMTINEYGLVTNASRTLSSLPGDSYIGTYGLRTELGADAVVITGGKIVFGTSGNLTQLLASIEPYRGELGMRFKCNGILTATMSENQTVFYNMCSVDTDMHINQNLTVSGQKNRLVKTKNFGNRLLYCVESTTPIFSDCGEGIINETGECIIEIDPVFIETISTDCEYQVFLQREGRGDLWVDLKESTFFVVKGTENLKFAWEIKAKQIDYTLERLEEHKIIENENIIQESVFEREIKQSIHEITRLKRIYQSISEESKEEVRKVETYLESIAG